jgi:4,5-DOPA dioxygenase extradiol
MPIQWLHTLTHPSQGDFMYPTLFVSHGAPTYALEPGLAGAQLAALGRALPQPAGVLVVSPHWMTRQPQVAITAKPETIHDFGGFDDALYDIGYPAPGHPELARKAMAALRAAGWAAEENSQYGLDHGAWVPLRFLYPKADVPVFQVSLPHPLDGAGALAFGAALAPLKDEGVLIVGSGSLTHNLYEFRSGAQDEERYVSEFVGWIRDAVTSGDTQRLAQALRLAPHAARAHPTAEHFLPLVVAAGAAGSLLPATTLAGGTRYGMLSMESYVFGAEVDLV